MNEEFRSLKYDGVDYSGVFEVSNLGNLRRSNTMRLLKPETLRTGYYSCRVTIGSRKDRKHILIHKAVAETFIGPRPSGLEINHKNGIKTDNRASNLEYCTPHENQQHKFDTGLFDVRKISGVNNSAHKLTMEQVRFIRRNYKPYDRVFGARGLSRMFNIRHVNILRIIRGKSYIEYS